MKQDPQRAAWTAHFEGKDYRPNKYRNIRTGGYASKREAEYAQKLHILEQAGKIHELKEQVPFELIPAHGRLHAVKYFADFVYRDQDGHLHVIDVKGGEVTKTGLYRLKARLMHFLLGIDIEEV